MKIGLAQINCRVGDIDRNCDLIVEYALAAKEKGVQLVVFPELALTGYPPEDLLFRESIGLRIERAINRLCEEVSGIGVIVGYPRLDSQKQRLFNAVGLIDNGKLVVEYFKQFLPNYLVFDEKRYFTAGDKPCFINYRGFRIALSICEDIWYSESALQAKQGGADLIININASPFHVGKVDERLYLLKERAQQAQAAIVYLNMVGAQDELIFDGGSAIADCDGGVKVIGEFYRSSMSIVRFLPDKRFDSTHEVCSVEADSQSYFEKDRLLPRQFDLQDVESHIYRGLVLSVRDYVNKNGFPGVLLGLSGGIDSALTLAIAVDALGPERVIAVMMPYQYTSTMSLEDAEREAKALKVDYRIRPIGTIYEAFLSELQQDFEGRSVDTTEENLQARIRGNYLMSLSNKFGHLVLTTGNKSELAVGYATLYGDMAGGFDVLKDVLKTMVYRLSRYRNRVSKELGNGEIIPDRVITRAPSAELAPDQTDQDSLPEYDELDQILTLYIENDLSAAKIAESGFDEDVVKKVIRLVDLNEYKRRQAAIGPRITKRGFGRDRRYPITARWPAGD